MNELNDILANNPELELVFEDGFLVLQDSMSQLCFGETVMELVQDWNELEAMELALA